MHPELEKLIELALANGDLSEKSRAVILRKAESLGEDKDEVELVLEGRLAQTQNKPAATTTQKVGTIRKCPACGASITALATQCSDCGHELSDFEASGTIKALFARLEQIEKETLLLPPKGLGRLDSGELAEERRQLEIKRKKATAIRNFPIPNTREELLQLLHFIQPKIAEGASGDVNIQDWTVKFNEIIGRAKAAYKGDSKMLQQLAELEGSAKTSFLTSMIRRFLSSSKQSKTMIVIALIMPILVIGVSLGVSGEKADREKEAARLEQIVSKVNESISKGNYPMALMQAAQLKWEDSPNINEKKMKAWDEKREAMIIAINSNMNAKANQETKVVNQEAPASMAPPAVSEVEAKTVTQTNQEIKVVNQEAPPAPAPVSFAPSFNCANALTGTEKLICSNSDLSALDVKLSQLYQQVMSKSNDINSLKKSQNEWRKTRRDACSNVSCLIGAYEDRNNELSQQASAN